MPRASHCGLGCPRGAVVHGRVVGRLGDPHGVERAGFALVALRPPDEVAPRKEAGAIPVLVEFDGEPHRVLLVAEFAPCSRCYGLAASGTTRTRMQAGSDDL